MGGILSYLNPDPKTVIESLAQGTFTGESKQATPLAILKDILATEIKINEEEQTKCRRHVTEFVHCLVRLMKMEDKFFNSLYSELYYTGSSYENLRIKNPHEFDIDLVLQFPLHPDFFQVLKGNSCYGAFKLVDGWKENLKIKKEFNDYNIIDFERFKKTFLSDGDVMPCRVRSWLQSIVDKVAPKILDTMGIGYKLTASGPARTFRLFIGNSEVSVDIVPVIRFSWEGFIPWTGGNSSRNTILSTDRIPYNQKFYFLVPKEASEGSSKGENSRMWRIHFPTVEKRFIHDRGCVKPVIKLLKLLRDNWDWNALLSSYSLKTTVMLELLQDEAIGIHVESAWSESKMFERLIQVMRALEKYVRSRYLPHVLFPDCNLLDRGNANRDFDNTANALMKIINAIVRDPSCIREKFCNR